MTSRLAPLLLLISVRTATNQPRNGRGFAATGADPLPIDPESLLLQPKARRFLDLFTPDAKSLSSGFASNAHKKSTRINRILVKMSEWSGEWGGNVGENKESGALETAVRLL